MTLNEIIAQNAINRKQAKNVKNAQVSIYDESEAHAQMKQRMGANYSVHGIDLFFSKKANINEESVRRWVSNDKGLGLGKVVSVERTKWRDGKGFTLTVMTEANTSSFDAVKGLAKARSKFGGFKSYDGAEFYCRAA